MIAPDFCMDKDYPERRSGATTPSQSAGITPEQGETKVVAAVAPGSTILWDDAGDLIRGYIDNPKTTLFIIERRPDKPHRGRMTGAVIPDEDEHPDGLLGNALISWLQGCAAPMYLREFEDRLLARRSSSNVADEPRGKSASLLK
jgi:hypothetical protein